MELSEILSDALVYPLHNITSMALYLVLGIIAGIVVGGTIGGVILGINNSNVLATLGSGIIGIIVALFMSFVITGYQLDIIKYGIERSNAAPRIDIVRQFFNGIKLFAMSLIYYCLPIIIVALLAIFLQSWVIAVVSIILFIIFSLAQFMAQCRLAKTEDLGYALAIGEAIGDISRVGILRLLAYLIVVAIIIFVLFFIAGLITQWNSVVGGILMGIIGIYLTFFMGRATGLLYSDV